MRRRWSGRRCCTGYFLYDWHIPGRGRRWHGFTHPRRALENALGEFELGKQERNAILPAHVSAHAGTSLLPDRLAGLSGG